MSWREFCFNLRPITLLAFGAVIFTTVAVAAALHHLLGWPWSVAFVLGASCRRRTWSHRSRSRGGSACPAAFWSCSKAKGSPMTPPR